MYHLALNQYLLPHWYRPKICNTQGSGDAGKGPESGFGDRGQGTRRADIEDGSGTPAV